MFIALIFIIGITGYIVIENMSFVDSLYMTIITVSTVGFNILSDEGKFLTIFLIVTSLGTFAYTLSLITSYIVEGKLNNILRGYIKKSDLKKMKNHVIICGYGRNGIQSVNEFKAYGTSCIVIDKNRQKIERLVDQPGVRFLAGDATEDELLIKAGINSASALITTLPVDADNLYVVLTARSINNDLTIISRASGEAVEKKLHVAGVDHVVMPEQIGGAHMAKLVSRPDIIEFLDHLSIHGVDPTNLEEIFCNNMPEQYRNMTIYEIGIRKKSGANIIGFKTIDGEYILNPTPDTVVIPNSKLFVLGTPEQIQKMKSMMKDNL